MNRIHATDDDFLEALARLRTPTEHDFCGECRLGTLRASRRRAGRACGFCGALAPDAEIPATTEEGDVWVPVHELLDLLRPALEALVEDILARGGCDAA